jgi:hypothetical protein
MTTKPDTPQMDARPRVRMYPHHVDYSAMAMQFRPFVMYMHAPHYASRAVNTDELGLRVQYLGDERRLDWQTFKDEFPVCDVIVGNSTLFGVDSSSDKTTIAHYLNQQRAPSFEQPPVLSIGVRGATSQQEIVVFQALRRFMPKVRKLIIFSGILGATSIALPNAFIHPEFGTISEEAYNLEQLSKQYQVAHMDALDHALHRFHDWIDLRLRMNNWLEKLVLRFFGGELPIPVRPEERSLDEKFRIIMGLFANDMANWAALARGMETDLSFVLQPAINWTDKPLTRDEQELFDIDSKKPYFLERYATKSFYERYSREVRQICAEQKIEFEDANLWLNEPSLSGKNIFIDVCHLTDLGNKVISDHLSNILLRNSNK